MSTNHSFWQDSAGSPGIIRSNLAPTPTSLLPHQLLIKVSAWAINPADTMIQDTALPFITYPLILGEDVSGTIIHVGSSASSKFSIGDRVIGLALGAATFKSEQGGFQEYVVLDDFVTCVIPENLSFAEAVVFPLGIATAGMGLFSRNYLGLPYPSLTPHSAAEEGGKKTVVVWGGSSTVGSNAIQLSKAAGFNVITTCSSRNHQMVKDLGADTVFDYTSPSVIEAIVTELDKGICAGIFHAAGAVNATLQITHQSRQKPHIASVAPIENPPDGVEAKWIFASGGDVIYREISDATFGKFLPSALAANKYKVAPRPEVVSRKGVEGIQAGLDVLRRGVSAKKIVVTVD
ncbi:MAG: hypothetical protein Q9168_004995 [Polycauliona sp. 1 TL-2023]